MRNFIAAFLLLVFSSAGAQADVAQSTADSARAEGFNHPQILAGLTKVSVAIGNLDPWLAQHGLTAQTLEAATKSKLKTAGITVVTEPAEPTSTAGESAPAPIPIMYVKLKSHPEPDGSFAAYFVHISLVDSVVTQRNKKELLVSVWDASDVGRVQANMTSEVVAALDRQLDQFVYDYNTANPLAKH